MIYRIAEPVPGGKGLLGIYPSWQERDHALDARLLEQTRKRYVSILFTRNYFSQFFQRISLALSAYGQMVDIVAGWDVEKIRMFFLPLNPQVVVFPLSAMHFNHFDLMYAVRNEQQQKKEKAYDLFFVAVERPDQLKNMDSLAKLLGTSRLPMTVIGYGKGSEQIWKSIDKNPNLKVVFRQKAKVDDVSERQKFLLDLAHSRGLLISSKYEGYNRLMGEALFLQVPVLMPADIQCENWVHLNQQNCRVFIESTFEVCLKDLINREWHFPPPSFEDGNQLLKDRFNAYLIERGFSPPEIWHPLEYGGLNANVLTVESLEYKGE